MKRTTTLLLCLGAFAAASAQLRTETVLPRKAADTDVPAVFDSLTHLRVNGSEEYYRSLRGQRLLFYTRDVHADLKPVAFFNFLAEEPAAVAVDTVWLRKPRRKVRPGDFRLDTVYSDVYRPRYFGNFGLDDITPLGCALHEARGIGTLDYSGRTRSGWFTPAEAVEGRSFEILGVEKGRLDNSHLRLFRLRDEEGRVLYWFAHAGDHKLMHAHERYPALVEGQLEKYRRELLGRDFFLTGRKPEAPGYVSEHFGLQVNTLRGESSRLLFDTELRCTDVRLIGDGTGYAVPSFVFDRKSDSTQVYIPLTRYPAPFGVEGYMQPDERAFVDELLLTPSEVIYARRAEEERQREAARLEEERQQRERRAALVRKYGKYNAGLILDGRVQIGMSREMCREAWGAPDDINSMSGNWGVHEQWVYESGSCLYFENGVLTTIQN